MEYFSPDVPFWKGNLHMHTTESDGRLSMREAIELYREHGYHFVALTDHDVVACPTHMDGGMLVLSGIELAYELPSEELHIVGIGIPGELAPRLEPRFGPQYAIDAMRAAGGRAIIAHPAWSLLSLGTISGLHNVSAAEIYNSMSTMPRNCLRADSSPILDIAAAHGHVLPLVAVDDAHFYDGEHAKSFIMLQAETLTQASALHAMDERRFYASQGPQIHRLSVNSKRIRIECSPVSTILFYSNLSWVTGRCRMGEGLTESEYDLTLQSGETFVRCQIIDPEGKSAWTNPIVISEIRD